MDFFNGLLGLGQPRRLAVLALALTVIAQRFDDPAVTGPAVVGSACHPLHLAT